MVNWNKIWDWLNNLDNVFDTINNVKKLTGNLTEKNAEEVWLVLKGSGDPVIDNRLQQIAVLKADRKEIINKLNGSGGKGAKGLGQKVWASIARRLDFSNKTAHQDNLQDIDINIARLENLIQRREHLVHDNMEDDRARKNDSHISEMKDKNLEFDVVLKDAMEKGYAEADPTFDIEGIDAAHKICILASLAFNKTVDVSKIFTNGISKIKLSDLKLADSLGYSIKLIAAAVEKNNRLEISVEPTLVKKVDLLSNVEGVFNAVEVEGDYVGKTLFYGRGAGKEATASAVVADIVKASLNCRYKDRHYFNIESDANLIPKDEFIGKFYVRVNEEIKELDNISFDKHSIKNDIVYFTNEINRKKLEEILLKRENSILKIN